MLCSDATSALVFENEILGRELVKHAMISDIESAFVDDGSGYLQFKYYTAGTLSHWYHSSQPKPHEIQQMFTALFQVVDHCHRNHITHGNLSPENILVHTSQTGGSSGVLATPVLIDFGLCRERLTTLNLTMNQSVGGAGAGAGGAGGSGFGGGADSKSSGKAPLTPTPGTGSGDGGALGNKKPIQVFAAPEVLKGESPTPASDVWSLAIILFRLTWPQNEPVIDPASGQIQVPPHGGESLDRLRELITQIGYADPKKRPNHLAGEVLSLAPYFAVSAAQDLYESRSVIETKTKLTLFSQYLEKL